MRKLMTLVLATAALAVCSTASFAAFGSVSKSTYTAWVSLSAAGTVSFSVIVKNVTNGATVTSSSVTWTGAVAGTTKWKEANQYVELHTTITAVTGGIQIYTDNRGPGATGTNFEFKGSTTTTNPAGLVGYAGSTYPLSMVSSTTLPVAWSVKGSSCGVVQNIYMGTINPTNTYGLWSDYFAPNANQYPCFLWLKDKATGTMTGTATTAFENGEDYITIVDALRGIQHAEDTWSQSSSPCYVFFAANFEHAVSPAAYQTNTLRIESFTE